MQHSLLSGMVPALSVNELNGLADILAALQKQILAHETPEWVIVDPRKHAKHATSTSRAKLFSFERMAQDLAGLRLLPRERERLDEYRAVPFFLHESWERIAGGHSYRQKLGLTPYSAELLIGMYEPYMDLVRRAQAQPSMGSFIGSEPPLIMWRAAWLDLQGVEQAVLLRLERAMQWEFRWLQLEGIFGQSLEAIFGGLEVPGARGAAVAPRSSMLDKSRVLEKVGKKLNDHGLLTFHVADQYLALAKEQSDELLLVWQATQSRLHEVERAVFFASAHKFLVQHVFARAIADVEKVLTAGVGARPGSLLSEGLRGWQELQDLAEPAVDTVVLGEATSHPIFMGPLFLEWSARLDRGHPLPLPEDLRQSDAAQVLEQPLPVAERFHQFANRVMHHSALVAYIKSQPLASMASDASASSRELGEYLQRVARPISPPSFRSQPDLSMRAGATASSTPSVSASPAAAAPIAVSAHLRKIAAEELTQMRQADGMRYRELRDAYINSLEPTRRKLVSEVQSRLQPEVFDEQIKHSLLKFMVENPQSWRSAKRQSGPQAPMVGR